MTRSEKRNAESSVDTKANNTANIIVGDTIAAAVVVPTEPWSKICRKCTLPPPPLRCYWEKVHQFVRCSKAWRQPNNLRTYLFSSITPRSNIAPAVLPCGSGHLQLMSPNGASNDSAPSAFCVLCASWRDPAPTRAPAQRGDARPTYEKRGRTSINRWRGPTACWQFVDGCNNRSTRAFASDGAGQGPS